MFSYLVDRSAEVLSANFLVKGAVVVKELIGFSGETERCILRSNRSFTVKFLNLNVMVIELRGAA